MYVCMCVYYTDVYIYICIPSPSKACKHILNIVNISHTYLHGLRPGWGSARKTLKDAISGCVFPVRITEPASSNVVASCDLLYGCLALLHLLCVLGVSIQLLKERRLLERLELGLLSSP
jgi:hypothetical protein